MVKYLLDSANSMDLNCQDNYGNTPLHAACEDGSIDVAKVLITAGKVRFNGVESLLGWLHLFSQMARVTVLNIFSKFLQILRRPQNFDERSQLICHCQLGDFAMILWPLSTLLVWPKVSKHLLWKTILISMQIFKIQGVII